MVLGLTAMALVIALAGCTSWLSLRYSEGTSNVESPGVMGYTDLELGLSERLSLRAVLESAYYSEIRSSLTTHSRPSIAHPTEDIDVVVFSLTPMQGIDQHDGIMVYPYAMFLVDTGTREVLSADRVTPKLSEGMLRVESLMDGNIETKEMRPCAIAELSRAEDSARHRTRAEGMPIQPQRVCDDDITKPTTVCTCLDTVPGHYNDDCLGKCPADCWN